MALRSATFQPFRPIPTAEITGAVFHLHEIRPLEIAAGSQVLDTQSAPVAFAFLAECALGGLSVSRVTQDGRDLDNASLIALNSYLRTGELQNGSLPWRRTELGGNHRYAWADFCEHLALNFCE